jgi:hypothetical protein
LLSGLLRGIGRAAVHNGSGASSAYSTKTYGQDVLTIAQIEDCIVRAQQLDHSNEELDALSKRFEAESQAIDQAQSDLQAQKALVNRYSEASVKAYNTKLELLQSRIAKHNTGLEDVKIIQMAHNQNVQGYNRQCIKKYYQDDMVAVKKKLGLEDDAPEIK